MLLNKQLKIFPMQRKVMKQGPSTLVVSLPTQWVKKNKIQKGNSVHLEEKGKTLILSLLPQAQEKIISLNLSQTVPMTHRVVGALYKAGFDEMTLTYSTSEEGEAILTAAQTMTGHEVISH